MNAMVAILADSAIKGIVLIVLAWVIAASMRRSSAAARHMVWALGLGGLLLLPVLSLALPKWQLPILPEAVAISSGVPALAGIPPKGGTPEQMPALAAIPPEGGTPEPILSKSEPIATPKPATPPTPPRGFWIVAIWLVFSTLFMMPFVAGVVLVRRIVRRGELLDRAPWPALIESLSSQLELHRRVRLFKTKGATMPMAVGVIRPAILLPAEAEGWPDEKRRIVLLHELAHVRRWDCLTHVLMRLACVLHWFNPLAWMALQKLQNERERACDDLAIEAGARPVNYAHQLLEIARTMQAGPAASTAAIPMARKTQLEGRLLAILDATRNRRGLTRFATVLSIALAAGILLPLSCARLTKAGAKNDMRPPITLSAHKYYVTGGNVPVNLSIGNWDYETFAPTRKFLRFEGRDYPFGYASAISGNAGEGFGLTNPVPNGMQPGKQPWLKPGKHKVSIIFRDVKIRAKSYTQEKQPVLASFDEVVTNEVEYEVVDRFPDGYFELIRDKKLVDAVRQKFAGIRYWPGNSYPSFRLHWKAGLPVNLAYDIAIQAENETTTRTVATIALEAGGDEHSYCLSMTENSEFPKELEGKRIRLIMTPSFKAAMSEPSIRKFYGETVVTDWMRLKLDIDSAAINLQDIGITRRTHTDVKQNEGVSEQKALGVVLRPGKDGGGVEVMQGRNSRIMRINGIKEPSDAFNVAQASLEQLARSETKRIPAQPDDFTWIAIQTDFDENLVMLIDASANLDQQFSWWNLDQKTTSLVVVTGNPNDKQRYEMGLGHGSMTQFYMKAKKHLGQLEWKYLGDGPTGKKYHLEFSEQAGMPFKQVMAKDIEYKSGNLTIFDNGETWIGIEVKAWGEQQSTTITAASMRVTAAEKALKTAQGQYHAGVAPRADVRKAEYELALAKADAGGDRNAALKAKLAWAEEELSTAKGRYEAGTAPREDVRKAEYELKLVEAESGGDMGKALQAKVDYAREVFDRKHSANAVPLEEVRKAEIQLKETEAEQAKFKAGEKLTVTETTNSLQSAQQAIQARMRLIRSKMLKFEYTRSFRGTQSEACTLIAYGGNYREVAHRSDGKTIVRYFLGTQPEDPHHAEKWDGFAGFNVTVEDGSIHLHQCGTSHWIDGTLAKQWWRLSESWPQVSIKNDVKWGGQLCTEIKYQNVSDYFAPDLGWAYIGMGDQSTQFSDFVLQDGIYWPKTARRNYSSEKISVTRIDTNADFYPGLLKIDRGEASKLILEVPLWREKDNGVPAETRPQHLDLKQAYNADELRFINISAAWARARTMYGAVNNGYPMPYFDERHGTIMWAKYDKATNTIHKVFEGDQLPASYGPLPWQDLIDMVKGWSK